MTARHRILVLWATPRTASTAFERMMIARGDHTVFDEPFSRHYYFGPEKRSTRFAVVMPDSQPEEIIAQLEGAAADRPVFVKDMAYHVDALASADFLGRFVNTFLVRDPAAALPSLAAHWPDFTDDEAGYAALAHLVALLDARGHDPVIVDNDDLRRDPDGTVRAYCEQVGIAFDPTALHWEPGMRPEWELSRGDGFALSQVRLGPGRLHHATRWLAEAERAFDMMCERAQSRSSFGKRFTSHQMVQQYIADSRIELEAAKLLTLRAAWRFDNEGNQAARSDIAMCKVYNAQVVHNVVDRALQVHGSLGYSSDLPLERMYRMARMAPLVDGANEVHKVTIARQELKRYQRVEGWPSEHIPTRQTAARARLAHLLEVSL